MNIGDWFIYENYIVLRVYDFEEDPYKFTYFLIPRVFPMEYIRKMFIYDQMHFLHFKH